MKAYLLTISEKSFIATNTKILQENNPSYLMMIILFYNKSYHVINTSMSNKISDFHSIHDIPTACSFLSTIVAPNSSSTYIQTFKTP